MIAIRVLNLCLIFTEKVPWTAMRTLLSQCIYGGKVDNEFDQRLLESFLEKIFSEKCFEPEHPLVDGGRVAMPEGVRRDQFLGWIEQLADRQVRYGVILLFERS